MNNLSAVGPLWQCTQHLSDHYGVESAVNRRGQVVVSESSFAHIVAMLNATAPEFEVFAPSVELGFGGIDIVTAPDWTFNSDTVAFARARARLRQALRPLRRLSVWLEEKSR